jgi:hypothetical protein
MGPAVISGYLKKRTSEKSFLQQNTFLVRYFVLDMNSAVFKFASSPQKKFKVIAFRDIKEVIIQKEERDINSTSYPYMFLVVSTARKFILGAKSYEDRKAWVDGFNVLFEYRERINDKQKLLHQIPQNGRVVA